MIGDRKGGCRGGGSWREGGTLSWAQAAKVSLMAAETTCVAPG